MIWVIVNIHFDHGLLARFSGYYRERKVDGILAILRGDVVIDGSLVDGSVRVKTPYQDGPTDNEILISVKDELFKKNRGWYIPADLDEFYWTPGLSDFNLLTSDRYDYIPSTFVDRLAFDGSIPAIDQSITLDEQFPLQGKVIKNLCGGSEDKIALARWNVDTTSGHHAAKSGQVSPFSIFCHHFKFSGDRQFWAWMNHREGLKKDSTKTEFPPFREHFFQNNRIDIYNRALEVKAAPMIGV